MKISYNWLKEFVNFNQSANKLAEDLNLKSVAVEEVVQKIDDKIIVGKILEIKPHPNADRLSVLVIDSGKEKLQIVCGAKNFKVGDIVPLATLGAKAGQMHIAEAEIRGVKSYGMLCSERELEISASHEGIKILPNTYKVGEKLNKYIESDALLDIEITPQRGDLLSHIGLSRELSAIYGNPLKLPELLTDFDKETSELSVEIENKNLCPQYFALKIKGIKIAPSPKWLIDRLTFLGINPINNIVDITNYVMLESGQPMHVFDASKITDSNIIIRESGEMEKVTTLDGTERLLPRESLVIADKEKILAIAGIMGGKSSEVQNSTTDIVLESAEFDRKSIRTTSQKINLSTEASYRFERGIDSVNVKSAIMRAAYLIKKITGGHVYKIKSDAVIQKDMSVEINYQGINSLLGTSLEKSAVNKILTNLGFKINNNHAVVPMHRHDISAWQDLAEEVARIYGYEKIIALKVPASRLAENPEYYAKENIKDSLYTLGFSEVYNYIYLSDKDIKLANISEDKLIEIANPIQSENKYLRNSLTPGLLKNIAKNPVFDSVFMFEFGKIFISNKEMNHLAVATAGKNAEAKIKEAQKKISSLCGIDEKEFIFKEIHRDILLKYKIKKTKVFVAEIDVRSLLQPKLISKDLLRVLYQPQGTYRLISQYPPVSRDIAFVVDSSADSNQITNEIRNISNNILLVTLFDEFVSDKLGARKKNVAFHVLMQNISKSMTDNEANKIMEDIIKNIENKFNAKLRS